MMYPVLNNKQYTLNSIIIIDNIFENDELQSIKKYCEEQPRHNPQVNQQNTDDLIRKSNISWIFPNDVNRWFYKKYVEIVQHTNDNFYSFEINSQEPLQYTSYDEKNSHYDFHVDTIFNRPVLYTRKLSSILFLSDPSEYTGGELILKYSNEEYSIEQLYGRMVVFPSFIMHKVKPIKTGKRNTLVNWFSGPPLR